MTKQTIRFSNAAGDKMAVLARINKSGLSVFVRTQKAGQRAVIVARNVFLADADGEKKAQAAFDGLVKDAPAKGWTRKLSGGGGNAALSNVLSIPSATSVPDGPAAAPKAVKTPKANGPIAAPAPKAVAGGRK